MAFRHFAKLALAATSLTLISAQAPPQAKQVEIDAPPVAEVLPETRADSLAAPAAEPVPEIARVRLSGDGNDRLTVPVRIGENGTYPFLIDTGSQGTVVSDRLAQRLAIPQSGRVTIVSTASMEQVSTVRLPQLGFANQTIPPMDAPMLGFDHLGVDGILGLDALQDLRVLIDFRRGRMDVANARDDKPDGRFDIVVRARRLKGQMIITDAEIDGVRTAVIIDTGSQISIGNAALLERLGRRERGRVMGVDVLGTRYLGRVSIARQVSLGRLSLGNLPIAYIDSPAFSELGFTDEPAMLLGVGNLRQLDRIAIDFVRESVLFDVPDDIMRRQVPTILDRRRSYTTDL